MRDITKQERPQTESVQLEKLTTVVQLIAGVAHEMNNPLTAVIGYAELLKSSKGVSEEIGEDLEKLYGEAQRASKILRNLMIFARKTKSEKACVNINEVLRSTLGLKAYDLKIDNIAVVEDFQNDLPGMMADPQLLQKVFLNLITNAEYAMKGAHSCRRLEIQTRFDLERSSIRVSFKDNGPGSSEEKLSKVFDPFLKTKEIRADFGLSVSYVIVQEHGGNISAQSSQGEGTTFTVELPQS